MDRIDISDITESSSILSRSSLQASKVEWRTTFTTFLFIPKLLPGKTFVQLNYYKPGIFIVNQYRICTHVHTPTTVYSSDR